MTKCSIEGCSSPATARGWCGAHYQRWRRHGDPLHVVEPTNKRCTIDGCDKVTNARGLCSDHYYFWKRYGDPLYRKNAVRVTPTVAFEPRACATCGNTFQPRGGARKYCGPKCRPSGRSSIGVNNRRNVEALAKERGWTCRICNESIDPELYWPNSMAGSTDHIVAAAAGGSDDWDNLQLTHFACNVRRG